MCLTSVGFSKQFGLEAGARGMQEHLPLPPPESQAKFQF